MSSPSRPYLHTPLYPVPDFWAGGPGLLVPILRVGLWVGLPLSQPADGDAGLDHLIRLAVLNPEMPYSVLPFSVRESVGIRCDLSASANWQGRPIPAWRGIPCRVGHTVLTLHNERTPHTVDLPLLVLLPDRDPPGPRPEMLYLGMEFLRHYGLRLSVDYGAIQYLPPDETGQRQLDRSIPAGFMQWR